MKRRAFFSSLFPAAAVTAAAATALQVQDKEQLLPDFPESFEQDGWEFKWSGYIRSNHQDVEFGRWMAYRKVPIMRTASDYKWREKNSAYWCTSGSGGWFVVGDYFNMAQRRNWITSQSSLMERETEKIHALARLKDFIKTEDAADARS